MIYWFSFALIMAMLVVTLAAITFEAGCGMVEAWRDLAIAAGSRRAETGATPAQCEASQSGAESASPKPHPSTPSSEER